jgi:hypothetical protein
MTAPFGEEVVLGEFVTQRLKAAIRKAADMLSTPQFEDNEVKVFARARPRRLFATKRFDGFRLGHRIHWLEDQRILEINDPEHVKIRFGVTGSGELAVKFPAARDVHGNAVLIWTTSGMTELLDTWQILHDGEFADELQSLDRRYIADGLERSLGIAA